MRTCGMQYWCRVPTNGQLTCDYMCLFCSNPNHTKQGVRHICPNCTTEGFYLNTFDDGPVPRLMSSYFDSHLRPDVVFGAAGQAGGAVINRSAIDGTLVVGVDTDEYVTLFQSGNRTGSDRILTSAMKSLANAVKAVVYADIDGDFRGGRTWTFDFSNAGSIFPHHVPCAVAGPWLCCFPVRRHPLAH